MNNKKPPTTGQIKMTQGFIRAIAHLNIGMQIVFPLALSFTPMMVARAETGEKKFFTAAAAAKTIPYVLQPGDTLALVAEKHHLTVAQLKTLNQYRTFAHGFESVSAGDEIDVPAQSKSIATDAGSDNSAELAQRAQQAGNFLQNNHSADSAKDLARGQALGAANSKANQEVASWLNGKGKARVKLDADRDFSLKNSELDVLYPLWENNAHQIFTQGSVHHTDSRNQSNLGLGYRYFEGTYMLGANTFFDHDWSRSHSRLGLGAEYQRDFLKVAANAYMRLTNWKNSPDFDNYEERPANGWDIRTEGYLPAYPGIGGKLVYEQYYGDRVGLFGKDNQQKDPVAVTAGVNYSPFPLMKFNIDHRMGKSNQNDTRFGIDLNYVLGAPLSQQLDSGMLAASRSLAANRYDFVDRNNNIVLEYRKKETISLRLASQISGYSGESKSLGVSVNSTNAVERIEWTAPELLSQGGQIVQVSEQQFNVIIPEYQYGSDANNSYVVSGVAYDKSGNASPKAESVVIVASAAVSAINSLLTPTEIVLPNDGQSTAQLTLVLQDNKGQPVVGVADEITMNITQSSRSLPDVKVSSFRADSAHPGTYLATLTAGTQIGVFSLTPMIQNVKISPATAIIGKMSTIAKGALTTINNDAVANGVATNEVQAIVTNAFGKPVANEIVTFSATNGAIVTSIQATTNGDGIATTTLSSTKSGSSTVTATINNTSQTTQVNFVPDSSTANIANGAFKVTVNDAAANGSATNAVQVVVTDAHGNPVPNVAVKFSAPGGVKVGTLETTTNETGIAASTMTSTQAGSYTVTALVNGVSSTADITFIPDSSTAEIASGAFTVTTNDAAANGSATNAVQVVVTDANGNPVPNVAVKFSAPGAVKVGTAEATTNEAGIAVSTMTSTQAGSYTVSAQVNGANSKADITFIPDSNTAGIASGAFTVTTNDAPANGTATNGVQVIVTDANGNPVPNAAVNFSAPGDVKVITATGTTNESGIATSTMSSTKSGSYEVTAQVNGKSSKADVTFMPDSSTAEIASGAFTVTTNDSAANGSATNAVQVIVTDANGNPVPNIAVKFSASEGVKVITTATTTNESGIATSTMSSTKAGSYEVTALVNGKDSTADITFIPDSSTAEIASGAFTVTTNDAAANGSATNAVQVIVTDANGNPVPNVAVSFTTYKDVIVGTAEATTNESGIATSTMTSTKAGSYEVTALVNGKSSTADITFMPDSSTAEIASGAFTVTSNDAVANGSATNTVQVIVTDANGNPVPNAVVSFSAPGDVKVITATGTTNESGIATSTMSSTKSGSYEIMAQVNGKSSKAEVTFMPDSSTAEIASGAFTVTTNDAAANGSATNAVQVIVTDANGNPVPNVAVSFTTSKDVMVGTAQATTNESGIATSTMTSTKAGSYEVTALVNGKSSTADITFIPDSNTAGIASGAFTVTTNDAPANGTATNGVQVIVTDANGNPVPNAAVNFSAPGDVKVITATGTTNESGIATSTMSSTKSGSYEVTAQVNGKSSKADVTFMPDSSTAEIASGAFTVTTNDSAANGSATNAVQVIVTDANGNPVPNIAVKFSASEGVKVITTATTTNESGIATSTMSSTKAGSYEVTALVNGKSSTADITFIPDSSTAEIASGAFTVTTNDAAANGSATNAVQVIVTDANGNPVPNVAVSFTTSKDVIVGTAEATTNESGIATSTMTSTKAGSYEVTALVNGKSSTADITFMPDSSTAEIASGAFTVTSNDAVANGSATNTVQVIVTDANGNPVPNAVVSFSAPGDVKVITATGTTNESGIATSTMSSTKSGSYEIMAQVNGKSSKAEVTFMPDSSTAEIASGAFTVTTNDAAANGSATNAVQVIVTDANGNPVPNVAVSFTTSKDVMVGTAQATTNESGIATSTMTSTKAGSYEVTALVNGKSSTADITFIPDSSTAEIASGAFTVTTNNEIANGTATNAVQVIVTDANGNPVPNVAVSFSTSKDVIVGTAEATTNESGIATSTMTSTKAGSYEVTALVNGKNSTADITFIPDSSTAEIASGAFTVTTNNEIANGTATNEVQVVVTDANGNPVPNVAVSFSTSKDVIVGTAQATTNEFGIATSTMSSTKAGSYEVTALVNGKSSTADITFIPDSSTAEIASGAFTVTTNDAAANGSATNAVQVIVTDANGNPVPNVAVSFSTAKDVIVGTAQATTNESGIATSTMTSTKAGSYEVTALVNGKSSTADITFMPDSSTAEIASGAFTVTTNNEIANGTATNAVQVIVTDANGNPVPNAAVSFSTSKDVKVGTAEATTNESGIATSTMTSTKAGSYEVTALVNGKSSTADITFIPDSSTAGIASKALTVVNNSAVADGVKTNKVQAIVTDAYGNVVPGVEVVFSADNTAKVINSKVMTDNSGVATTTLTSTQVGSSTVTATVNGDSQKVSVTFVVGEPVVAKSSLSATPMTIQADGTTKSKLTLTLQDSFGRNVGGQTVAFVSSLNGSTVGTVKETSTGVYSADLTTVRSGSTTLNGSGKTTVTARVNSAAFNVSSLSIVINRYFVQQSVSNGSQILSTTVAASLNNYESILYSFRDGSWSGSVTLPATAATGSAVRIVSEASQETKVSYSGNTLTMNKSSNTPANFLFNGSNWVKQ